MPTYRITAPDGKTYNVTAPDGTTPEQALAKVKGQFSAPAPEPSQRPAPKPITPGQYDEAWLANVAGLGFDVGDEAVAGVRSLFGSDYGKELSQIRQSQQKLGEYDPFGNILGKVAGGVPVAFATGGPAAQLTARALPNAGRVVQAAAVGSGFGAGAGFGAGEGGVVNRLQSAGTGAVLGAGFGATVEGVVSPVVGNLVRYMKGSPTMFDPNTGNMTPQGMKLVADYAKRAGLDVDQLSDDLQREMAKQAGAAGRGKALNPQQALAMAEANSLPVKGPMTQGQLTQDPYLQLFESEASKGRYGPGARQPIERTYAEIQEALQANAEAIRGRVAGSTGGVASEPGMRGQTIQGALTTMRGTAKSKVDALYQAARQGGDAAIDGNAYRQGVQNVINDVVGDFDPTSVPKVFNILNSLGKRAETEGAASSLVSNVFRTRRQLTSLQGELGAEGAAAGAAKKALDKYLVDTMDQAALSGDTATITRWREAIKAYREYATKFQGDDFIQKLTERGNFGAELKVDPADAVNVIFGRDDIGFVTRGGMVRDLRKMKTVLGDDSAGWKAIKEEAFLRFLRKSDGAMRPTERAFSGAGFAKAWAEANKKSPHVLRELFTPDEMNVISQFSRYAQRVTLSQPGGVNTSNTGGAIAQLMQKMLGTQLVGPKVIAFLEQTPMLRGLTQIPDSIKAAGLANPVVQTQTLPASISINPAVNPLGGQMSGRPNRRQ
jgi:hypothetical protein